MKARFALFAVVVLGAAALWIVVASRREAARHQAELADARGVLEARCAKLEVALAGAELRARAVSAMVIPESPGNLTPREIIARLRVLTGGGTSRNLRQAVYWFEELGKTGPAALPAIREFLAHKEDLDLDVTWLAGHRAPREKLPGDFVLPPSLRFGLFDIARQVGGADAERLLADTLGKTARGVELAYLTRVLHETSPGKYRDKALAVAHALLADGTPPRPASPLDRFHRDHLYGVLAFYNDGSFARQAQAEMVRNDGVDRAALGYLRRTMGPQAVAVVAQASRDPRLADPTRKEPLARVALDYVGVDPKADELWQEVIDDLEVPPEHRSNLIEDLNENGFPDPDHPTPRDLPLIESRIALIERLLPRATDPVNQAAFKEAYKDLKNMRAELQAPQAAR